MVSIFDYTFAKGGVKVRDEGGGMRDEEEI
jgi:hypothetical protein